MAVSREPAPLSTAWLEAFYTIVVLALSVLPLLFAWATASGLRLSLWSLALITFACLLALGVRWRRRGAPRLFEPTSRDRVALLGALAVFAVVLFLRIEHITGLVLPLWVDSVHHAALARLIAAQGALPTSYRPYAEVDAVFYHLGFHVALAAFAWLTQQSVESVMLWFGQALNALAALGAYVLAARWTGRALGGLAALVVVGTVSLMPAYYVTWGRYTQLEGLVILPLAMLYAQRALDDGTRRNMALASLLSAGLFLVHYRVTLFLVAFVVIYWLYRMVIAVSLRRSFVPFWRRAVMLAALSALLALPWLWRLWSAFVLPLDSFVARIGGTSEYNEVPWDLVSGGAMPWLLALAALGLLVGIVQRRGLVLVIAGWLLLLTLLINPSALGLGPTWIINNFALVIALYLPLALLAAFVLAGVYDFAVRRLHDAQQRARLAHALTIALVLVSLWTGAQMRTVVNPITILAERDDLLAFDWIARATPSDAVFLVNERLWQGSAYVGSDAGYWLPQLTGRRTTMPIVLYTYGSPAYVARVNALAQLIESAPDPDDENFLRALRAWGVTHVYLGAKGGPLSLEKISASAHYQFLFAQGAARVFVVRY